MDDGRYPVRHRRCEDEWHETIQDRDLASFRAGGTSRFGGSDEEYRKFHAGQYGVEERLDADGVHPRGSWHFPPGSSRQKCWERYNGSTRSRDKARKEYDSAYLAADLESQKMSREERKYYNGFTGGFPPHQHERLDPLAREFRDTTYHNATGREDFLQAHPFGYHNRRDQHAHYRHAEKAYTEFEDSRDWQRHHEKYRSYVDIDSRRDRWGRPVRHDR